MVTQPKNNRWAMLSYRIPREPSTPRIAVWRRLKELGVAQVVDGLVALPHTANTQEQLEWVSAKVRAANGEAVVWVASPSARNDADGLVEQMTAARNAEYQQLLDEIHGSSTTDSRTIARWRRQHRRIGKRDYFRAERGELVRQALLEIVDDRATVSS